MSKLRKPVGPTSRRQKPAARGGATAKRSSNTARSAATETDSGFDGLSAVELNDLNGKLAPALGRGDEFDALWTVWSQNGDYVAASATGLAAAACRALVDEIHARWFALRRSMQTIERIDLPLAASGSIGGPGKRESKAQALNRLVAEIKKTDKETLASERRTMRQLGDEGLLERAARIRKCPEWSNEKGILHNHPPEACVLLFRTLLVSPPVYKEVKDDLIEIARFRKEAIAFREKLEAHEKKLRELETARSTETRTRLSLSGLTYEGSDQFRDLLDSICAGDVRTRHGKDDSERVATVRLIAEHFRAHLNLSRSEAADRFRVEPWSTGIAALAHAALYYQVTTEQVRGALKNWASD